MAVQKSPYRVVDFTKKDMGETVKILHPLVSNEPVLKDLEFCLKKGFFYGIKKKKQIVALAAGFVGENGVSLSYYYISDFYRSKPLSLFFILHTAALFRGKKIFIRSVNTASFDKYIKKTDDPDVYEWVGFEPQIMKLLDRGMKWAEE